MSSTNIAPKIISALPPCVSPEEHKTLTSTTPESFASIPPVLRFEEPNVSVFFDPPLQDLGPDDCKRGRLYIIESVLAFMSVTGRGFQIEYPSITLHAISRNESGSSIYCQLDETPAGDLPAHEEDDTPMRELKIVPERVEALEPIFESMSSCAALHPDPEDELDMNGDTFVDPSNFEVFNGDADQELSEVGRVRSDFVNDNRYTPY
ncbi:regulator of volume decrease after cellular swelling-domain-containing protein [Thelephora terrestris]|uniref:Regulator of volume decrease after cellular swelling-domain-containing protein n=1 Tax=Thelephora terrestris TaxID=56493 RepID=A0A9P6L9Z3_9AGAM|nr:regulator of volume decrease after cellular swelling-domain-containing protein [Thelephora terrestris]